MKSEVYFAKVVSTAVPDRAEALGRLLAKTRPLMRYAARELVPVKLTIGDAACVRHVAPELVRLAVDAVKGQKAKPFLFDTNVIYHGERQNAVDHLNLAAAKGFTVERAGAPFLVADGVLGQDGREHALGSADIRRAKLPSFVGALDSLLVLSHSTGHIFAGYAGAVKNVAMGMSCRPTKQVQHSSMKPVVTEAKCTACGRCAAICPVRAIAFGEVKKARIAHDICVGCGECLTACQFEAIEVNWEEDMDTFGRRMVDVAKFVLGQFKNKFFITFAFDITQECDCISTVKDPMIMDHFGIFASTDILALDQAVVDMAGVTNPFLEKHPAYENMFAYAEKVGLGRREHVRVVL